MKYHRAVHWTDKAKQVFEENLLPDNTEEHKQKILTNLEYIFIDYFHIVQDLTIIREDNGKYDIEDWLKQRYK